MPVSAVPQQLALYVETAFVTGGPATDFPSDGTFFYVIEPDKTGVAQASLDNENNLIRPFAVHENILGLRNGNLTFGIYMHGSTANAAEGAAAVTYHVAELLQSALGGKDLGYAAAVESSGTEQADEIEITTDPGYEQGDWVFYKQDGGVGEFYRVLSKTGTSPTVLTVDRDVHVAVVDRGEDDTLHAVIDIFLHQAAVTQYGHASHKTLQFLAQGDHAEDIDICKGCKAQFSIEPITAGEPAKLNFDVLVTTFEGADEATKQDFANATPVGEAGIVPGLGTTTYFKMADFGSALATVKAIGSITVEPGANYERIMGPNGHEGVHGHIHTLDVPTLEVMVEFDKDYKTEYRAKTKKHALIQVGNDLQAWGVYFPRLSYTAEPDPGAEGGIRTAALSFKGMEDSASPGSLTGDSLEKWRTPLHLLIVA